MIDLAKKLITDQRMTSEAESIHSKLTRFGSTSRISYARGNWALSSQSSPEEASDAMKDEIAAHANNLGLQLFLRVVTLSPLSKAGKEADYARVCRAPSGLTNAVIRRGSRFASPFIADYNGFLKKLKTIFR